MATDCEINIADVNGLLAQQFHRITEQIGHKAAVNKDNELVNVLTTNEQLILSYLIDNLINAGSEYSQELEQLIQIDASFSNLQTGNYGICSDCDKPIAGELLAEAPFRQRCRSCLTKHLASPNEPCSATIRPLK